MRIDTNQDLLKSLVISKSTRPLDMDDLSDKIKLLAQVEIEKIQETISALPLVAEKSETYSKLPEIMILLLQEHKMNIRLFENHCHSCIIPETELAEMAGRIHEIWQNELVKRWRKKNNPEAENPDLVSYQNLSPAEQKLYYEFIYLIPVIFKKTGYEIIRTAELNFINASIAGQMARVIHSSYKKSMISDSADTQKIYEDLYLVNTGQGEDIPEFDDLPDDFKISNLDSAYHIPTKLLSIGYRIQKVDENDKEPPLLRLTDHEVETLARIEHDRWSWERRMSGWTYSETRDNEKKHHNCLLPYDDLSEKEKDKDRVSSRLIPALLKDIGYEAIHISPELREDISYIKRDWGYISKIITELDLLKAHFQDDPSPIPDARIDNIEVLIRSIKDSFTAGKKIQKSFLSTILKFKEYLPDSFVLYKPKDIVSGDFYYIEKNENRVIFAAADCTGHGIPAAILTSACYNLLDQAVRVKGITDPSQILGSVFLQLDSLFRDDTISTNASGMDITVCTLDLLTHRLQFSGFGNPLYFFKKGEFDDRTGLNSLVDYNQVKNMLVMHELQLHKGDTLYIFSDGYKDQFGGPDNQRFKGKRFLSLLKEIQTLSIPDQCEMLNQTIEKWRRSEEYHHEQTDDILVIGVMI